MLDNTERHAARQRAPIKFSARFVRSLRRTALAVASLALVSGCAVSQAIGPVPAADAGRTTLLVAGHDGSVQTHSADVDADMCLRSLPLKMTVCYAKGAPRLDPVTHEVTGHEMVMTLLDTH